MKNFKYPLYIIAVALLTVALPSCKSKKKLLKDEQASTQETAGTSPAGAAETPARQDEKPDFNFHAIQFGLNSKALSRAAVQYLDHIAAEMRKNPETTFVVDGYASAEGPAKHNMKLSLNRANAVKRYMVSLGIDGSRLVVKGYGETNPVAPNSTESGRERNRRVEVKLVH